MPSLSRLFFSTISVLAILGILLLSGDRYDWMPGLDQSIDPSGIETDGSRSLVRTALLAVSLAATMIMIIVARTRTRGNPMLPLVLFLASLAAYVFSSL